MLVVCATAYLGMNSRIYYTSPEGLNYLSEPEKYKVGTKSDEWSIACVMLELLIKASAWGSSLRHMGIASR